MFDSATNSCKCVADASCASAPAPCSQDSECSSGEICVDGSCVACDSSKCGQSETNMQGTTFYCVYDNGWKWATSKPSNFCCNDNNCKDANGNYRYDPGSHTKIVCDSPDGSYPHDPTKPYTYTCKPKPSCSVPDDCEDYWCCTADPTLPAECKDLTGSCVERGTRRCDNKYLCDPPEGFELANKKLSLLDFLIKFNPFS